MVSPTSKAAQVVTCLLGDGLQDLIVTRLEGPPYLFRNLGNGSFARILETESGITMLPEHQCRITQHKRVATILSKRWENGQCYIPSSGAYFADFDADGHLDVYITTIGGHRYAHPIASPQHLPQSKAV